MEPLFLGDVRRPALLGPRALGLFWPQLTTMPPYLSWLCFSLGRPSSIPESEMRVPLPAGQKFLESLVALARIMSKCATLIYRQNHKSLAPVWNAANEIRRELLRFAEQQRKDLNFGLVGDPGTGELGVCQTVISTSKAQRSITCQQRCPPT
jgi:hypothetical protein